MPAPILHIVAYTATHHAGTKLHWGRLLVTEGKTWLVPNDADAKRYPYLHHIQLDPKRLEEQTDSDVPIPFYLYQGDVYSYRSKN